MTLTGRPKNVKSRYRVALALGLTIGVAASSFGVDSAAQAAAESTPALSITLDSPEGEVASGDELSYTATLANLGDGGFSGTVEVEAPSFVLVETADGADVSENVAVWQVDLSGVSTASFDFTVAVGEIPSDITRVTTLVSVYQPGADSPIVRTAHAARIEGVAEVPGNGVTPAPSDDPNGIGAGGNSWGWILAGIAALMIVGVIVTATLLFLRRRRVTTIGPRRRGVHHLDV
jgi:hypothetical protein